MDRESGRPRGRSARGAQHLRDISHLYLSSGRTAQERERQPRACFRLGLVTASDTFAKVDLCANLALQYARLGRRTLVMDLDPSLPNVGFRMGLPAPSYLSHLGDDVRPHMERGALGIRLLEGVAGREDVHWNEDTWNELQEADCVLVNLPDVPDTLAWLRQVWRGGAPVVSAGAAQNDIAPEARTKPRAGSAGTTMARAGATSRMFGAWLQTARGADQPRGRTRPQDAPALDTVLFVQRQDADTQTQDRLRAWRAVPDPVEVHLVRCLQPGSPVPEDSRPAAWATLPAPPAQRSHRQPSSLLFPEHEVSRRIESLAQGLLARGSQRGGAHVRAR